MSTNGPADDESVVCVTPAEGSVNDELIEIKVDNAPRDCDKDSSKDGDKTTAKDGAKGGDGEADKRTSKVKVGMVCDKKNLYQKRDRYQPQRFIWTEEYPEGLEEAAENEQTMKYALLVRNSKSTFLPRLTTALRSDTLS